MFREFTLCTSHGPEQKVLVNLSKVCFVHYVKDGSQLHFDNHTLDILEPPHMVAIAMSKAQYDAGFDREQGAAALRMVRGDA